MDAWIVRLMDEWKHSLIEAVAYPSGTMRTCIGKGYWQRWDRVGRRTMRPGWMDIDMDRCVGA